MPKVGVGRYLRLLGVMEIAFAAPFVVPATMKLGFILASCYFAGAIATELSHAERDRYRFASHARYVDAFIDEVVGTEPLTLVLHDWGGALGCDWAYRHQQRVRAIAYMETFVAPLTLEDLPESFHPTLKAVRSSEGEALVLDENMFIEKMLPGVTQRTLSVDEMEEYRRPFLESGDGRWPTLQWAREVPLSGEPADVHDRIAAYAAWLKTAPPPKLFVDAEPGVFVAGRVRRLARG